MTAPSPDAKQLLTLANLARVRGNWVEAERNCQQAVQLAPDNAEAWELLGDACYAQRKGAQAINYFRRAHQLNPGRGLLEEKIGKASLLIARQEMLINAPELYLAGRLRTRSPSFAGAFSCLCPGLGQLYNGQWQKGFILITCYLGAVLLLVRVSLQALSALVAAGQRFPDMMRLLGGLLSGWPLFFGLVAVVIWGYSIVDAAYAASKGEEVWKDEFAA